MAVEKDVSTSAVDPEDVETVGSRVGEDPSEDAEVEAVLDVRVGDDPSGGAAVEAVDAALVARRRPGWRVHAVLALCQVCFSGLHVSSKRAIDVIPPVVFTFLRVLIALPCLVAFCCWQESRRRRADRRLGEASTREGASKREGDGDDGDLADDEIGRAHV